MARRRRRGRIPWLALIALMIVERWIQRERAHDPITVRRRNSLARILVLERIGYYSPWFIAMRLLAGLFRRRDGSGALA